MSQYGGGHGLTDDLLSVRSPNVAHKSLVVAFDALLLQLFDIFGLHLEHSEEYLLHHERFLLLSLGLIDEVLEQHVLNVGARSSIYLVKLLFLVLIFVIGVTAGCLLGLFLIGTVFLLLATIFTSQILNLLILVNEHLLRSSACLGEVSQQILQLVL